MNNKNNKKFRKCTYLLSKSSNISNACANRSDVDFGRFATGRDEDEVLGWFVASSLESLSLFALSLLGLRLVGLATFVVGCAGVAAAAAGMNRFERTRSGWRDSLTKCSLKWLQRSNLTRKPVLWRWQVCPKGRRDGETGGINRSGNDFARAGGNLWITWIGQETGKRNHCREYRENNEHTWSSRWKGNESVDS